MPFLKHEITKPRRTRSSRRKETTETPRHINILCGSVTLWLFPCVSSVPQCFPWQWFCNDCPLAFWSPLREAAFQAFRYPCQDDAGHGDDDHADKQRVGCERLSAVGHHEADPLAAAEHFADHHPDQAERDALADAGQDEGHRPGDRDGLED